MEPRSVQARQPYPWRLFFLLLAGSILGVLALLPYLTVVLHPILAAHPSRLPLAVIALIQGTTNFGVATGLGLLLARKIGLGAPVLEAWLYGRSLVARRGLLWVSCLSGLGLGLITLGLLRSSLGAALTALPIATEGAMPLWKRFLACFYGGLCEEILMRLFLMSLVAWLLGKFWKAASGLPSPGAFWCANILVAIAFGAGHLPLAAQLVTLTPSLVTTVIALNAMVALGFGYLYWKRGLEAAMIAHFSADVVLHVLGPMF
jgi:membrane protease YdiL (CAAX protease family)